MSAAQDYSLRELGITLQYELELQNVPSTLHLDGFPARRPDRVYVLLGPSGFISAEGRQALPDDSILKRTVFVCDESGPAVTSEENLELLRRAGAVFTLDQRLVVALHRMQIPARLLRPGYSQSLDRFDPEAPRPLDVMFLGAHSPRRTRYLAQAARVLSRRNCLLQISEDVPTPGATSSFLGPSRWPFLAQTKVVIDIHPGTDQRFDWRGALDAIHAGAVVASEHSFGVAPLVPGQHLLVSSPDALPFVVERLLADDELLARLRTQAYERLRSWSPFALSVSVLRAALVELVGVPVAAGASLGTWQLPAGPSADGPPSPDQGEIDSVRRELDRTQQELVEVRRQLAAVQDSARSHDRAPAIKALHESPSWRARRAPRVSVVTALGEDADAVAATFDSLAASRQRDFELVAVDAAASELSRSRARRWMIDHPRVAARLMATTRRLGAGEARNVALDFARGAYCLLLDPGQRLYPRCIDVLAGTLEAMPDVTFVYPMDEVIGAPDEFTAAGGDHLLSYLGWDPGRLRRGNYIHSPALIRVDQLREAGGFATDPRLAGLEDYDLWCRIAERGWRGQLVPQELSSRAESESSPVLASLNPSAGMGTDALMERAPALLAGAFPAS